jgi:lipase chaperone LimK
MIRSTHASRQTLKPLLGDKAMARKALQPCRCTWREKTQAYQQKRVSLT